MPPRFRREQVELAMRMTRNRIAQMLILALIPVIGSAAPVARITASLVSGPAPLAVLFDATTTTDSNGSVDTFKDIGYKFTFGDPSSGTWTQSGKSKNEQIGAPLAAHVFESAGTFVVQVMAKDAAGASTTASVTVTVTAPDTYYA